MDLKTITLLFKAVWAESKQGNYQKASEIYKELIASGHSLVDAYCGFGVCQKMLGNHEAAVSAAQEALLIKHDHFRSLQLLASIYSSQGNHGETYEYVSRALSCIPKSVAETSPRLANFARKTARFFYRGEPDDYVEEMLGLDEEDRIWIAWAREFKAEYEKMPPQQ